jgi:hypothetical protein
MIDIYALIIICSIGQPCYEVRDRVEEYTTISECKSSIVRLESLYNSTMVTCHKGDILEDDHGQLPESA